MFQFPGGNTIRLEGYWLPKPEGVRRLYGKEEGLDLLVLRQRGGRMVTDVYRVGVDVYATKEGAEQHRERKISEGVWGDVGVELTPQAALVLRRAVEWECAERHDPGKSRHAACRLSEAVNEYIQTLRRTG